MSTLEQQTRAALARRRNRLVADLSRCEASTLAEALAAATAMSSGTLSLAQLRAMGHPYRIGGPNPLPAALINARTGRFRAGWRAEGVVIESGTITGRLINDSPEARWMGGTERMIPRPILAVIEKAITVGRLSRLRAALRRWGR